MSLLIGELAFGAAERDNDRDGVPDVYRPSGRTTDPTIGSGELDRAPAAPEDR